MGTSSPAKWKGFLRRDDGREYLEQSGLDSFVGPAAFEDGGPIPKRRMTPIRRTAFTRAGFTTLERSLRSGRNLFFFNLNVLLQFLKLLLDHHIFRVHLE